jgi:hypothetical protein
MDLAETLLRNAGRAVKKDGEPLAFSYRGRAVDLAAPFARVSLPDQFKALGLDYADLCRRNGFREAARGLGLDVDGLPDAKCFDAILDERVLPHLPSAAFLFGYPALFSPLAKASPDTPDIAERFELFLCGEEVANAYSEQNDPDVQRRHFEAQAKQRQAGDEEAMPADEEFVVALEHGMPPAGGLGIGVDRLTMILTGTDSIRDVILFPLLRNTRKAEPLPSVSVAMVADDFLPAGTGSACTCRTWPGNWSPAATAWSSSPAAGKTNPRKKPGTEWPSSGCFPFPSSVFTRPSPPSPPCGGSSSNTASASSTSIIWVK